MAWTKQQIEQYITNTLADDLGWSWSQWNDECIRRAVHIKYDQQLATVQAHYEAKLIELVKRYKRIRDRFSGEFGSIALETLEGVTLTEMREKALRLVDKWRTVNKEIEGRDKGFFVRTPIGTTYYIDLNGGNDANTGLNIGQSWLTLEKYTTVTVRTAGDIAFVRANTTEAPAGVINVDEDGDADNYISIIGADSVVNDPWGDASDVLPDVNFSGAARNLDFSGERYWWVERLDLRAANSGNGNVRLTNGDYITLKDCVIRDSDQDNVVISAGGNFVLDGCEIKNADDNNIECSNAIFSVKNSTLDSGAKVTTWGIFISGSCHIELISSSFGQSSAHASGDLFVDSPFPSILKARDTIMTPGAGAFGLSCQFYNEDSGATYGDSFSRLPAGTVTKDTGAVRGGGASSSAKMELRTFTGVIRALKLSQSEIEFPFALWLPAAAHTVSIWIRSIDAWGTYPTNSELFCIASYLDHAVNGTRTDIQSAQVLSHPSDWVEFTMGFTSQQEGFVYINTVLGRYELNKGIYVDVKPVVS